jgi:DedD protein
MADTEQASQVGDDTEVLIRKRARRRLVGATALALLAAVVLPLVMDKEPRPSADDIQIRIPAQDGGGFAAHLIQNKTAPTPLPPVEPVPAQTQAPAVLPTPPAASPATVPPAVPARVEATPAADKTPASSAPQSAGPAPKASTESVKSSAAEADTRWVVQLGAYHDPANIRALRAKVKELGYASYVEDIETSHGTRTRVRAGPFVSREAALKAQQRLKKIGAGGPAGGVVVQK